MFSGGHAQAEGLRHKDRVCDLKVEVKRRGATPSSPQSGC
jgi:hypothetical protein